MQACLKCRGTGGQCPVCGKVDCILSDKEHPDEPAELVDCTRCGGSGEEPKGGSD